VLLEVPGSLAASAAFAALVGRLEEAGLSAPEAASTASMMLLHVVAGAGREADTVPVEAGRPARIAIDTGSRGVVLRAGGPMDDLFSVPHDPTVASPAIVRGDTVIVRRLRGVGRGAGVIRADQVTLLGRTISAPQTGVGDTRSPSIGISTPTVGSTANVYGRVEGVIRQVNPTDNRIVVETDRREIFNIRTSNSTPVTYHGDTYQVSNLEVGDRVRIDSDGSTTTDREIRARSIEVTQSVQEGAGARVSSVAGRVTRIDRTADVARVDTGRGEVRVDMSRAYDSTGRRVRAADLQVGDRVDISGSYGSNSQVFSATTVRFNEDVFSPAPNSNEPPPRDGSGSGAELVTVSVSGTVTETLQNAPTLSIRDRMSGRVITLYVTDDFAVRTKSGSYTTADHLNVNDGVLVKAYRDADGNYIAQTIRMR
jgi:hypothetical protein